MIGTRRCLPGACDSRCASSATSSPTRISRTSSDTYASPPRVLRGGASAAGMPRRPARSRRQMRISTGSRPTASPSCPATPTGCRRCSSSPRPYGCSATDPGPPSCTGFSCPTAIDTSVRCAAPSAGAPGTSCWGGLPSTVGDLDQAAHHFEAALVLERRWGARAWIVKTRAELRRTARGARRRPGDHDRAVELGREATAQAEALQMTPAVIPGTVRRLAERSLQSS